MSGKPLALIGYAVSPYSLSTYRSINGLDSGPSNGVAQHLQSALRIPICVAHIEDDEEIECMICCFVSWSDTHYNCEEMMAFPVPVVFTERIPTYFQTRGGLRRVFARRAIRFASDGVDKGDGVVVVQLTIPIREQSTEGGSGQAELPPSRASLDTLPAELILTIAEHLLFSLSRNSPSPHAHAQEYGLIISHINSRLRAIALAAPWMWVFVRINHKKTSWEMARLWYERSGQCDLHVKIDIRRSIVQLPEILVPLSVVSSRLQTLIVKPNRETQAQLREALSKLTAPRLRTLVLDAAGRVEGNWEIPKFPQAPGLTTLKIGGVNLASPFLYPDLTTLEFQPRGERWQNHRCLPMTELVGIIRGCPKLRQLTLKNLQNMDVPDIRPDDWAIIHLPDLRKLTINSAPMGFIVLALTRFDVPSLQELALGCSEYNITTPYATWGDSTPDFLQVHTLDPGSVLASEMIPPTRDSFEGFLFTLLAHLPNVTCLKLYGFDILKVWVHGFEDQYAGKGQLLGLKRLEMTWSLHSKADDVKSLHDFINIRREGYPRLEYLLIDARKNGKYKRVWSPEVESALALLADEVEEMEVLPYCKSDSAC